MSFDAVDSSSLPDAMAPILELFLDELRQKRRPSIKDYADRYPGHAAEIFELFPQLGEMEQAGQVVDSVSLGSLAAHGSAAPGSGSPHQGEPCLEQLGDYKILRKIALQIALLATTFATGRAMAAPVPSLKGVCPDKIVIQTDWFATPERAAAYASNWWTSARLTSHCSAWASASRAGISASASSGGANCLRQSFCRSARILARFAGSAGMAGGATGSSPSPACSRGTAASS